MEQRFAVAVAIEHDVGIDGQARQRQAQAGQFAAGLARREVRGHGGTDDRDVARGVVCQAIAHAVRQSHEQVRPIAVEISAAGQLVAADMAAR